MPYTGRPGTDTHDYAGETHITTTGHLVVIAILQTLRLKLELGLGFNVVRAAATGLNATYI